MPVVVVHINGFLHIRASIKNCIIDFYINTPIRFNRYIGLNLYLCTRSNENSDTTSFVFFHWVSNRFMIIRKLGLA